MNIYYDSDKGGIVVSRAGQLFAPKSLTVTFQGDKVTIWQADAQTKVVSDFVFTQVLNQSGNGFSTITECVEYLQNTFRQPDTDYETIVIQGLI